MPYYKYRLKFQMAMNDVYFFVYVNTLKNRGGGGGGGGGCQALITLYCCHRGSGGGKKKCKNDYVICERPLNN